MTPPANGLPIASETWWFSLWLRPSVLPGPSVRPKTFSVAKVTLSARPAVASCAMSEAMVAMPDTVCAASAARPMSR
jgi:hypothetical protein